MKSIRKRQIRYLFILILCVIVTSLCADKLPQVFGEDSVFTFLYQNQEKEQAYEIRCGEVSITLEDEDAVLQVLNEVKNQYDGGRGFQIILQENAEGSFQACFLETASITGISGYTQMRFSDNLKISETAYDENSITDEESASAMLLGSEVLSVYTTYIEEYTQSYQEETVYQYNDSWYENREVTLQEAEEGEKKICREIVYENGKEVSSTFLKEDILTEAVPKIQEIGTMSLPDYQIPLESPVISSTFGERWGKMHKGLDFACDEGTPVMAAMDGTIEIADWVTGYGYCIYLNHEDGTQTRYAHLSEILVSSGDSVSQGDVIAESGNTGNSTGPHLHFEILLDGEQVDPYSYIEDQL